jgi:CRP-like cAMP-binding protein
MNQSAAPSNLLLASLAAEDYSLLRPHLTQVRLKQQTVLQEPGAPIEQIYFPLDGMVSLVALLKTGEEIEIAAVGREGAIGTKIGLQPQLAFAKAIVQLPGSALRISLAKFQDAARDSLAITHLSTCANDVVVANLQQSAACNAVHPIEARLARWLLHARDRFETDALPLTQEFIAMMLAVRRTTVSLAAHALQEAGLISYRRGKIEITDREALEARSCECYGAVRHNIDLIIQTAKLAKSAPRAADR